MRDMKIIFLMIVLISPGLFALDFDNACLEKIQPYQSIMTEAYLNQDFEKLLDLHDQDALLMPPFQAPIQGRRDLKKEIRKARELGVKYHSLSGNILDLWECDGLIYEKGTLAFSLTNKSDKKLQSFYGSYFTIWRQQKDGSYKIKFSMWNLDFNPFEH